MATIIKCPVCLGAGYYERAYYEDHPGESLPCPHCKGEGMVDELRCHSCRFVSGKRGNCRRLLNALVKRMNGREYYPRIIIPIMDEIANACSYYKLPDTAIEAQKQSKDAKGDD